ncbi:MAG: sigma 54-interacting transcriptional regulator [Desulfobacterales bacterium]|nr:sigma 54-interacting transcriptional regulator [Desulfobacterales bacterium]
MTTNNYLTFNNSDKNDDAPGIDKDRTIFGNGNSSLFKENLNFEPYDFQPEVCEAWHSFIYSGRIDHEAMPKYIVDSWQRSKWHNVDPFDFKPELYLDTKNYNNILKKNKEIIDLAQPIMENIYGSLEKSRYLVVLYCANGYHLLRLGHRADLDRSSEYSIIEGLCFEEHCVGTCGFSLVKHHLKPIFICGCQHYSRLLHYVTGSYAPILHPRTKNLLGVLGVSGAKTMPNPHTLSIVIAATTAIENMLNLQNTKNKLFVYNKSLQVAINAVQDGFLIIDSQGHVFDYNKALKSICCISKDIHGLHISTLPQFSAICDEALECLTEKKDKEVKADCSIENNMYMVHLTPLKQKEHMQGVMLQFKNIREIARTYQKIAGYHTKFTISSICGSSEHMKQVKKDICIAAKSEACVVIEGESGTGKEVVAQAIHNESQRRNGPFVAVNCAAVPHELLESTLFGHEKGAFTGAHSSHIGKFELADSGTLFLDEIGEMSPAMQAKLLRAIEEKQIERVGGKKQIPIDIRILSATNRDLYVLSEQNLFRKDLYYRMNVFCIALPPLRERRKDINELIQYFVCQLAESIAISQPGISDEFVNLLLTRDFPGNIRELKNVIHSAMIKLEGGNILLPEHLGENKRRIIKNDAHLTTVNQDQGLMPENTIEEIQVRTILDTLSRCSGNKSKAAKLLGISRATLYRKLDKVK